MGNNYNSDQFFIHRFNEGDEKVFETIFNSDYDMIVGFCSHFTNDVERARNQAQEAFLNLWLNRDKIETINGIRSFLYTYAKSSCLNFLRHEKVESRYENRMLHEKELQFNAEALESFDFHSLEFVELDELIKKSIDELPEKCRKVFQMSRFEGKKNREIADELNITVKSVEANMTRALKSLKNSLSEYLPVILVQIIMQYLS